MYKNCREYRNYIYIPGQGKSLQSLELVLGPVQFSPPYSGSLHDLFLTVIPPPHVREHSDQLDQRCQ